MISYSLRRLAAAIPTLFVLIALAFFMIRVAPGGPFDRERQVPAEIEANLNARYHLDEPLPKQFVRYLGDVIQGDFGPSFQYKDRTVNELIATGFPISLRLGMASILLAFIIGVCAGTLAALKQNQATDYGVMAVSMIGVSIPNFVVAPLLILAFAVGLGWLPAGGWNGGAWQNWVLPVISLSLPQIAYIARITRGSMVEVLRSNFIRTARAKGMPEHIVIFRHAMKPALLPVVSFLGPALAGIITGSVVIERVFTVPGLGSFFVDGAINRDYTLVLGVVLFYGFLIIFFNFLVDLCYAWLDPKVRLK